MSEENFDEGEYEEWTESEGRKVGSGAPYLGVRPGR